MVTPHDLPPGDDEPDDALPAEALAAAARRLLASHRTETARKWVARACAKAPGNAGFHALHGRIASEIGAHDDALAAFDAALALRPGDAEIRADHAFALLRAGRPVAAADAATQALATDETLAVAYNTLGLARQALGDTPGALAAHRRAAETAPEATGFADNVLVSMQFDPHTADSDASAYAYALGAKQSAGLAPVFDPATIDRDPGRPLRVGYVSADFRAHPVGWMARAILAAHAPAAAEPYFYANQASLDALGGAMRAAGGVWRRIAGHNDETVSRRIAADRIDILVDLSGRTAGNRLGVFARRPAPVQVSWLGYFATSGLPAMDYALFDDHHLADGADALFSETLVRLPQGRLAYTPPDYAPEVAPPPAAASGAISFGSFSNTAKLNDGVVALWARLLKTVPNSQLLLKWRHFDEAASVAHMQERFAAHGIGAERLAFDGPARHRNWLDAYSRIDIALDPFPYSGALTTCEALWMGVPMVTQAGPRPVSRQSHALLAETGLDEWSAPTPEAYIACAAAAAGDIGKLTAMRASQRETLARSPLFDAAAHTHDLEAAFREMWQRWLRDKAR